ncbi:MAG: hypothetical protein AB8B47_09405 [Roseobacter sp.]
MIKKVFKLSFIVSAGLFLASCTQGVVDEETGDLIAFASIPEQKFVAGGFSDNENAKPKLVKDFTEAEFAKVRQKLRGKTENSLTGITSQAFIRVAESRGTVFGKKDVDVRGKIQDVCLHDPSLAGYYYNAKTDKLRLCVLMVTTIAGPKDKNNKVRYQYFHVEADKARVAPRDNADTGNVFPAAASKTGLKVDETTAKDFKNKLYAWGDNVKILNYWEANAKANSGNPKWKKYTPGQNNAPKRIKNYFLPDVDACVDMMFPGAVPETLSPGDAGGIHYCLGRCKHPPIVNTR